MFASCATKRNQVYEEEQEKRTCPLSAPEPVAVNSYRIRDDHDALLNEWRKAAYSIVPAHDQPGQRSIEPSRVR